MTPPRNPGDKPSPGRRRPRRPVEPAGDVGLSEVVEHAAWGFFRRAPDGHLLVVNRALAELYGYNSPDEMVAAVHDVRADVYLDAGASAELDRRLLEDGAVRRFEAEVRRKDGSSMWVSVSARAVRDDTGALRFVEGTVEDVSAVRLAQEVLRQASVNLELRVEERTRELLTANTALQREVSERRSIEAALRASEERFRALAENSLDVIMRFDREGRHLYVNSVVEGQTGIAAVEFIGKTHRELGFPERLCELWEETIASVFSTGLARRIEFELPNGIWIDWLLVPEFAEGGSVSAVMTSARDITDIKHQELALERRVAERTAALEAANRSLLAEVSERERMQAALTESEARLRTVVENMPVMLVAFDERGHIVAWNRECTRVTGYLAAEVIGSPEILRRAFPDRDARRRLWDEWQSRWGDFADWEVDVACKDGSVRTLSWTSIAALFPVPGWTTWAVGRDVSEQRAAERALREGEATARALLDAPRDIALLIDREERIVAANTAVAARWGLAPEQLVGRPVFDLMDGAAAVRRRDATQRVLATGVPATLRDESNGTVFDSTFYPVFDADGGVTRVAIFARDVTAAVLAEQARLRLATAMEQVGEAILITDVNGVIQYVNPAFEGITGYRAAEVVGGKPSILKSGRHSEGFYRELWSTITRGDVWVGHMVNRRKDGSVYEEEATISPIRDASGAIVNFVAVKRDVTREAALAEELRESQKMRAIGQLAGGVAHDFNNLLQALLGAVEVLKGRATDPEVLARTIAEIESDVRRGAALTRQLLVFARREVAKREPLDLNDTVRETAMMLRRLVREDLQFILELCEEALPVEGDRGQLQQVVSNLVLNAADAMQDGGRLVVRTTASAGEACLSVEDSGAGIPDEIRARIFEPFFTTKASGRGTGLGLTVVQAIMAAHGGRVEVDSRLGRGTVFNVVLPLTRMAIAARPVTTAPGLPGEPGKGERVLVIEDESGAREGLRDMLEMLGYRVATAASGEEALGLASDAPFDLVLTDLVLPGIRGDEAARILAGRWPGMRVILMSGYAEDAAVRQGVQTGAVRFLEKPFDMETLSREVRAALDTPPRLEPS